ncbi:hypothetical protein BE20_28000 [Sorangium cellulosum]|nr:hypothetical protein BE20_28000 [Sorangium cellulosum]
MRAPRAANVPCQSGGRWTSPTRAWKLWIGNANGYTAPSQPTTSSGERSQAKPWNARERMPSSSGPTNVGRRKSRRGRWISAASIASHRWGASSGRKR